MSGEVNGSWREHLFGRQGCHSILALSLLTLIDVGGRLGG